MMNIQRLISLAAVFCVISFITTAQNKSRICTLGENENSSTLFFYPLETSEDANKTVESRKEEITPQFTYGSSVPKYKNIKPPIKGIDVERYEYDINPSIENKISYPSGTEIIVPAFAFVDNYGNPVTEKVVINYREFRDPIDILVSGIPMKYDSGGVINFFESAGMFEITASANNQPLSLAKGKTIDMNFVTTSQDTTYNFYAYDDETGNWNYLNKPKSSNKKSEKIKIYSDAYNVYRTNLYPSYKIDYTSFSDRYNNPDYIFHSLYTESIKNYPITYISKHKERVAESKRLIKLNSIKKLENGDLIFKIKFNPQIHPELNGINNCYFVSKKDIPRNEFYNTYVSNKYYNDIRIERDGEDLVLKLKGDKTYYTIPCNIGTYTSKKEYKPLKNKNHLLKGYNKRLALKEKKFNTDAAKGKFHYPYPTFKNHQERCQYAYNLAKKNMSPEEKKMSYDEWMKYYEKINYYENTQYAVSNSLSLSGMGVYNCDQIKRIDEPVEIFVKYKTQDNEKLYPSTAFIIEKGVNSVFQYNGYMGYSASKIAFSNKNSARNNLLVVNPDGSLALCRENEFKKKRFENNEYYEFEMVPLDVDYSNVNELRKIIGL